MYTQDSDNITMLQ